MSQKQHAGRAASREKSLPCSIVDLLNVIVEKARFCYNMDEIKKKFTKAVVVIDFVRNDYNYA